MCSCGPRTYKKLTFCVSHTLSHRVVQCVYGKKVVHETLSHSQVKMKVVRGFFLSSSYLIMILGLNMSLVSANRAQLNLLPVLTNPLILSLQILIT